VPEEVMVHRVERFEDRLDGFAEVPLGWEQPTSKIAAPEIDTVFDVSILEELDVGQQGVWWIRGIGEPEDGSGLVEESFACVEPLEELLELAMGFYGMDELSELVEVGLAGQAGARRGEGSEVLRYGEETLDATGEGRGEGETGRSLAFAFQNPVDRGGNLAGRRVVGTLEPAEQCPQSRASFVDSPEGDESAIGAVQEPLAEALEHMVVTQKIRDSDICEEGDGCPAGAGLVPDNGDGSPKPGDRLLDDGLDLFDPFAVDPPRVEDPSPPAVVAEEEPAASLVVGAVDVQGIPSPHPLAQRRHPVTVQGPEVE
jgi:hypothetical protein